MLILFNNNRAAPQSGIQSVIGRMGEFTACECRPFWLGEIIRVRPEHPGPGQMATSCHRLSLSPADARQAIKLHVGEFYKVAGYRPGLGLNDFFVVLGGLGSQQESVLMTGLGLMNEAAQDFGFGKTGEASTRCGLGSQSTLFQPVGLGTMLRHLFAVDIAAGVAAVQSIANIITNTGLNSVRSAKNIIDEKAFVKGVHHVGLCLGGPAAEIHTITRAVYLDGRPITDLCASWVIRRDQSSVFNDITITSHSDDLWRRGNPATNEGAVRLEVHVAGDVFYFLVEKRSGGPADGFSLWGRDMTARESERYQADTDVSLSAPRTAAAVAGDLAAVSAVDWDESLEDYLLPDDFSFSGVPIDGIITVANEIGGIVRAQSDGSLTIRARYPVRPPDIATADPDISFDQTALIALRSERVLEALYDAVVVSNNRDIAAFVPTLELEETVPEQGQVVHVRVFWAGNENTTWRRYVTDGRVVSEGVHTAAISDELIEFADSVGAAAYPVSALKTIEWYGDTADISYTSGSRNLSIGADGEQLFRVCRISYTTEYERLRIDAADVPHLLLALYLDVLDAIGREVAVVMSDAGDDPVYADNIVTQYLTTPSALRARGTAYLDDHHYDYTDVLFEAPYNAAAVDGAVGYVNDALVGERGNYQIMAADIVCDGPKIINQIRGRRWH